VIVPPGVVTPVTTPRLRVTPVHGTPSRIVTPRWRAPLASAIVTPTGSARPSSFT
jgi:hypothetical protein